MPSADIHQIFPEDEMKDALVLHANNFKSCYLKNNGNGKFELIPLPDEAQMAPLNGMVVDDFNGDGNLDVALNGNDFGNEVTDGRYDAMNGLVLLGDGKGNFTPQTILQSGIFIPGDGKALGRTERTRQYLFDGCITKQGTIKILFITKRESESNSTSANR